MAKNLFLKILLAACLVLKPWGVAWADVSAASNGFMDSRSVGCDIGTIDVTGVTVSSGTNVALFWFTVGQGDDTSPTVFTAPIWDPAGANQTFSAVGNYNAGSYNFVIYAWVLVNPTPGASKTVRTTISRTDICTSGGAQFDGVDQTTPVRSGTFRSGTATSFSVSSAAGDRTVSLHACPASITGSNQTAVVGGGYQIAAKMDQAAGSASNTHTWTTSCTTDGAAVGLSIQAAGAGGTTVRRRAVVY